MPFFMEILSNTGYLYTKGYQEAIRGHASKLDTWPHNMAMKTWQKQHFHCSTGAARDAEVRSLLLHTALCTYCRFFDIWPYCSRIGFQSHVSPKALHLKFDDD